MASHAGVLIATSVLTVLTIDSKESYAFRYSYIFKPCATTNTVFLPIISYSYDFSPPFLLRNHHYFNRLSQRMERTFSYMLYFLCPKTSVPYFEAEVHTIFTCLGLMITSLPVQ
ncbi:hypothetical protein BYT27DRAFT_6439350 [Phlegmacium glaucopus]|nr:hypothetical protein BYT27DRAFT_6439350 [Phlegmacium glaucopus]